MGRFVKCAKMDTMQIWLDLVLHALCIVILVIYTLNMMYLRGRLLNIHLVCHVIRCHNLVIFYHINVFKSVEIKLPMSIHAILPMAYNLMDVLINAKFKMISSVILQIVVHIRVS